MKKLALTTGILITIALAVFLVSNKKPVETIVGNVTNPKDFDYIAPVDFNGQQISYVYTDDNTGEDLIIATDSATYSSWDSAYVSFAIKNTSATDQTMKIQFLYDGGASASEVEELVQDVPYQVTINDRGPKDYKCDTEWIPFESNLSLPTPNTYTCGKETPRYCDSVVKNTCTVENDVIGTRQETRYKDVYVPIAKGRVEDLKGLDEKVIDSKFIPKEQVSNFIEAGKTKYYRAKLVFSPSIKDGAFPEASGAFIINAYGDAGSFGTLDPWYNSSWLYRKTITIDETKVSGSADHTNFAVLIDITDSGLQANAQSDGDDIVFTSADGTTKLDHEIELYTSATGRLTAWVEIPTLDYNDNTVIYMYYGNAGASNQQNATGVWESNYKGVWHLKDGTTLNLTDSTSNGGNGVNNNTVTPTAGKVDGAANFVAASSQYVSIADNDRYSFGNGTTDSPFTYSTWVYMPNVGTVAGNFIEKYINFGTAEYALAPSNTNLLYVITVDKSAGAYVGRTVSSLSSYIANNTWAYITWTYSGGATNASHKIYINGVQRDNGNFGSGTYVAMENTVNDLNFAKTQGLTGGYLDGKMDEVRLYAGERNADWITTEYNNQSATSTFYTIGTQETDTATANIPSVILRGQMILQGQMKI